MEAKTDVQDNQTVDNYNKIWSMRLQTIVSGNFLWVETILYISYSRQRTETPSLPSPERNKLYTSEMNTKMRSVASFLIGCLSVFSFLNCLQFLLRKLLWTKRLFFHSRVISINVKQSYTLQLRSIDANYFEYKTLAVQPSVIAQTKRIKCQFAGGIRTFSASCDQWSWLETEWVRGTHMNERSSD